MLVFYAATAMLERLVISGDAGMKLSLLMEYVEQAMDEFGDIECYMDVDDGEIYETVELAVEFDETEKRAVITNYALPGSHLKLVK